MGMVLRVSGLGFTVLGMFRVAVAGMVLRVYGADAGVVLWVSVYAFRNRSENRFHR